jgi:hypothetical protein
MKKMLIFFLILLTGNVFGQKSQTSFGVSARYNIPLETLGMGGRVNLPVNKRLEISVQGSYTPKFNTINEWSAGVNLHYLILQNNVHQDQRMAQSELYGIVGVHYNKWLNYAVSINNKAHTNNILPEIGLGAAFGGEILKIFLEGKYNLLWLEPTAELGLKISPFGHPKKLKCFYY